MLLRKIVNWQYESFSLFQVNRILTIYGLTFEWVEKMSYSFNMCDWRNKIYTSYKNRVLLHTLSIESWWFKKLCMYPFRHIIESLWFKKLCMCPFIIGTKGARMGKYKLYIKSSKTELYGWTGDTFFHFTCRISKGRPR